MDEDIDDIDRARANKRDKAKAKYHARTDEQRDKAKAKYVPRTDEPRDKAKAKYHATKHTTYYAKKLSKCNAANLAKKNAANRAARDAAGHEAVARLGVSPEDILNFDTPQAAAIVLDIIENEGLVEFFKNAAIYLGTTSGPLEKEALRFLIQKWYLPKPGSTWQGNRAVLKKGETEPPQGTGRWKREWCEGDNFFASELKDHFGFQLKKIWGWSYLGNVLVIESMLQQHFQSQPLGSQRLWRRHVDFPTHRPLDKVGNHMVYIMWSTQVPAAIVAGHFSASAYLGHVLIIEVQVQVTY